MFLVGILVVMSRAHTSGGILLGRHGTDRTTYFIKVEHIVRIVQKGTFRVNNNGQNTASLKPSPPTKSSDKFNPSEIRRSNTASELRT
ncbi:hypothetical protein BV898_16419, partial [Hypsibius exemplaris]